MGVMRGDAGGGGGEMVEREEGCRLIAANYTFLFPSRRRNVKGKESDERWRPGGRGEASNFLPPSLPPPLSLFPSLSVPLSLVFIPVVSRFLRPPTVFPLPSASLSFLRHPFFLSIPSKKNSH